MSIEIREFRDIQTYEELPPDLISGLETCIASAFGGGITQEDARQHIAGQQVLVASVNIEGANIVKAFSSTSITSPAIEFGDGELSAHEGAYFAGAAICSTMQSSGLYHQLNARRVDFALKEGVDTIFTRTQNPRVQEGITASVRHLVDRGTIASYDFQQSVRRGAYGRMLTLARPVARIVEYSELDYDGGDAMILSWRLKKL